MLGPVIALVIADVAAIVIGIATYGELTLNTIPLTALTVWLLAVGGHYRPGFHLSVLDELPSLVWRVASALAVGAAYRELVTGQDALTADRLQVLGAVAALVVGGRAVVFGVLRAARRHGLARRRGVVVADELVALGLARAGAVAPDAGLDLVARIGTGAELAAIEPPVEVVVADPTSIDRPDLARLLHEADALGARLYHLTPLSADRATRSLDHIGWMPVLPVHSGLRAPTRPLKRAFDIAVGAVLLVAALPLIAVCAAVLRIESGPGVLFRQQRVGRNGATFTLVKLRTIVPRTTEESDTTWYTGDEETTRFAGWLRASSIDELPQLWNVLRGDMSLVGPRPERPHFVERFSATVPGYEDRHRVPVGLTGLAQVHGLRGDTSITERTRLDNAYIESWSLEQDVKILLKTMGAVAGRRSPGP